MPSPTRCVPALSALMQEAGTFHVRTTILPPESDMAAVATKFSEFHQAGVGAVAWSAGRAVGGRFGARGVSHPPVPHLNSAALARPAGLHEQVQKEWRGVKRVAARAPRAWNAMLPFQCGRPCCAALDPELQGMTCSNALAMMAYPLLVLASECCLLLHEYLFAPDADHAHVPVELLSTPHGQFFAPSFLFSFLLLAAISHRNQCSAFEHLTPVTTGSIIEID